MGLYERWTEDNEAGPARIAVHAFSAALRELARGAVTRAQVIAAFSLDSTDQTDLDAIIAQHQSLSTEQEKADFRTKFHDVLLLIAHGLYDKAKAKSELGF